MNKFHSQRGFTPPPTFTNERSVLWYFSFQNRSRRQADTRKKLVGGFTLIEMTVSLGLFTIVMFIATSSFLAIVNADRKSRSVRIATDNLNVAIEDMSRRIKTGTEYYCGAGGETLGTVNDCPSGDNSIFFDGEEANTRVNYKLVGNVIKRSISVNNIGDPAVQVTAPEIMITGLKFFVVGSDPADTKQPAVVIVLDGSLSSGSTNSAFKIQTTVTQRAYDIP